MANIKNHLNNIKNALFGQEVRGSIHDGIDAINKEVESTTGRQKHLEATFDQLIIDKGNSNAEILDARVGENGKSYAKLGDRLDEVDSQLEHIEGNNNDFILYSFFRNSGNPTKNDIYISNDGDTLKRINSQSIVDAKDPSIIYKNGWWLIAGTSFNPHDFTIYRSCDFAKWERHDISVGLYNDINNRIWAPEWFEDDNGDVYILLSLRISDDIDIDEKTIPSFRPYIIKCTNVDKLEFSSPTLLNLENKNKIDPCLIKENGVYHMFIKDEYDKFTEHWTSTDLINWTYKKDIESLGDYVEGQTIIKYNNKFYLYADAFKGDMGLVYYVTSDDLENWSERKTVKVEFNRVRHGTALVVKDNKAKQDIQKFTLSNLAIPTHNMRSKGFTLNQFANEEGIIENLEIIDNCIYSITNNEYFTINSFKNTNNAKCFYLYLSTNDKGSITINCNSQIVGVPNGYVYDATYGDNDVLIKFIYSESIGKFKPVTISNAFLVKKNQLKKGGWKTITLSSQTIESLDVEDGVAYRVNGGQDVVINDVSSSQSGTHFYLMLASGGSGSITINSGSNITVPSGKFIINSASGRNDVLFEFIKVDGSTFRLRQ